MAVVVEIPSCMFQGGCRDTLQTWPQQSNFSAVIIAIMVITIVILIIVIIRIMIVIISNHPEKNIQQSCTLLMCSIISIPACHYDLPHDTDFIFLANENNQR